MSPGISRSQYFFLSLRTSLPHNVTTTPRSIPFTTLLSRHPAANAVSPRQLPPLTTRHLFFLLAPTHVTVQVRLLLCNIYIYIYISFLYITLGIYIYSSAHARGCIYGYVKSGHVTSGLIFFKTLFRYIFLYFQLISTIFLLDLLWIWQ